jgi:putative flippase GtrA
MMLLRRVGRYAQVGLLCALINNAIVIAMDQAGFHYAISVIVGFLVVMLVGYLLHAAYTFGVPASGSGWLRFVTVNLSGFPLSFGLMFLLCDAIGLSASLAMPTATIVLFAWNFVLARWVIAGPAAAHRLKG